MALLSSHWLLASVWLISFVSIVAVVDFSIDEGIVRLGLGFEVDVAASRVSNVAAAEVEEQVIGLTSSVLLGGIVSGEAGGILTTGFVLSLSFSAFVLSLTFSFD